MWGRQDGVYGKENRVCYWGCRVLLLLESIIAELSASVQPHATDPFVAGVSFQNRLLLRRKQVVHLVADLRHFNLASNLFLRHFSA
jgi:hypothetical protein